MCNSFDYFILFNDGYIDAVCQKIKRQNFKILITQFEINLISKDINKRIQSKLLLINEIANLLYQKEIYIV